MSKKKVTKKEVKRIAQLAKLEFGDDELDRFVGEFNDILSYVSKIQECDTGGIEFEHHMSDYNDEVLQEDEVKPSLSQDKVLQNATGGRAKNGYVRTSKIVEKD